MSARATDSSVTFTVTASGIRTDFAYLDSDGNDLDRWESQVDWAPQLVSDGNPVLKPDWDCQKFAWLTGGDPHSATTSGTTPWARGRFRTAQSLCCSR